jgi:hypothetical protein
METMLYQEQTLQESILHHFKEIVHKIWMSFVLCFLLILLKLEPSKLSLKWQQCMQFKFMKQCIRENFTLFILYFQLLSVRVSSLILH